MRGAAVCLCLLLTGCSAMPQPREMGDMALLRAMGVDAGAEGYALTLSTDIRPRGMQGEPEASLVLSGSGEDLPRARRAVDGGSRERVFYGYVDQVLLGEQLARRDVLPVLEHLADDVEMGMGGGLWLVADGTAARAVEAGGEEGVAAFLTALERDGRGAPPLTRTAGEVYADLLEWNCAWLPVLRLPAREEAPLKAGDYAVLREGRLVGILTGAQARGLELLQGSPGGQLLDVMLEDAPVPVRLTRSAVECRLGDGEELEITCRVEARLLTSQRGLPAGERARAEQQLAAQLREQAEQTLKALENWGTDCLGLGPRAGLRSPERWRQLEVDWPQRAQDWRCTVRVTVQLEG